MDFNIPFLNETYFFPGRPIEQYFAQILQQFQIIDAKFQAIDAKFQAIDAKFQALDAKFQTLDEKIQALDAKFQLIFFIFLLLHVIKCVVFSLCLFSVHKKLKNLEKRFNGLMGVMGYCYEAALRSQLPKIAMDVWRVECTAPPIPKFFYYSKYRRDFENLNRVLAENQSFQELRDFVEGKKVHL
jgi:hypothetical protein